MVAEGVVTDVVGGDEGGQQIRLAAVDDRLDEPPHQPLVVALHRPSPVDRSRLVVRPPA